MAHPNVNPSGNDPYSGLDTEGSDSTNTKSHALDTYETWSMIPMFAAAVVWIIAVMFEFDPRLAPEYRGSGIFLNLGVVAVFLSDLIIRFILDPSKKTFLRRNILLVAAIVIPLLRFILILSAIRRIRRGINSITAKVGLYALYGIMTVVFVGSVFTLGAEINRPDSTIDSYGDAVWWAFVTVTTVGYGDYTPVTETGRVVAVIMMFSGAAAVGSLTAALASRFTASRSAAQKVPMASPDGGSEGTTERELKQRIEGLERRLEDIAVHLGVPASPAATRPPGGE